MFLLPFDGGEFIRDRTILFVIHGVCYAGRLLLLETWIPFPVPAIGTAFCIITRTTLVGSSIPNSIQHEFYSATVDVSR